MMDDPRNGPRQTVNDVFDPVQRLHLTRLHIGSGPMLLRDWTNLDALPYPGVDIVCDLGREPLPLPDASMDEVFMAHTPEHIGHRDGTHRKFLGECLRVLRPGGTIFIIGPNFGFLAGELLRDSDEIGEQTRSDGAIGTLNPFDHYEQCVTSILSDRYDRWEDAVHMHHWSLLTGPYVAELLRRCGFSEAGEVSSPSPLEIWVKGIK